MSESKIKVKIALVKKPIVKRLSPFVGGNSFGSKKITAHNDATIRR